MKIPTREEVYFTNNSFKNFMFFMLYETLDVFIIVIKWFFILFFLYLLFSNLGVSANWYMVGENEQDHVAHFEFSIPIKSK